MHTLYTTHAFIVSSAPHGESNRMYRLLTESHGLVYAHAQGVRELRNRNRYVLRTATFVDVTLVKGREMWRLTSARAAPELSTLSHPNRKILDLIGRFTPIEDPFTKTFRIFYENVCAFERCGAQVHGSIELIGIVRILVERGYLTMRGDTATIVERICEDVGDYTGELLTEVWAHRRALTQSVNNALRAASE